MVRAQMADNESASEASEAPAPVPCAPCRGEGKLISAAGGEQHEVPCPWCEGTGVTIPGHDAQAARRDAQEEPAPAAD